MPYISQDKRDTLDPAIDEVYHCLTCLDLDDPENNTEGNLNYVITRLFRMVYGDHDSTRYAQINDAMGVLLCSALEHYRTVAAPYENQKRHDNGSIERFIHAPEVMEEVVVQKDKEA